MSLGSFFRIEENGSTPGREIIGGATTFVALSYIIFVQPAVLGSCPTGPMDKSAVMFATCLFSGLACILMGLWAKLPIALAPAMGHNFFFAFTVCGIAGPGAFGLTWQEALAANFTAGILFLLLSFAGLRTAVMNAIPQSLKLSIAAGIGLLIAFIGLEWAGIIVGHPAKYVALGNMINPVTLLSLFGLLVIGILLVLGLRGAILIGMLITALAGYLAGNILGHEWEYTLVSGIGSPAFPNVGATFGKCFTGFGPLLGRGWSVVALIVFTFLLLDFFDTIGTLVGLGERSGLMQNGTLPRARQALMTDALATIGGAVGGTSTITSYIESSAGIAAGARTGLASVVTGLLLLLSIAAYPLVEVIGAAVAVPAALIGGVGSQPVTCYPVIAPVLIVIGCYMLPVIRKIEWEDFSEGLPAFLSILVMMLSMSITDGIAWGFISYAALKIFTGRWRSCPPTVTICAVLFVLYYVFARV